MCCARNIVIIFLFLSNNCTAAIIFMLMIGKFPISEPANTPNSFGIIIALQLDILTYIDCYFWMLILEMYITCILYILHNVILKVEIHSLIKIYKTFLLGNLAGLGNI